MKRQALLPTILITILMFISGCTYGNIGMFNKETKIILYNTHPLESYNSNQKITEVTKNFQEKLNKNSFNSEFLDNQSITNSNINNQYEHAYKNSRELLLKYMEENKQSNQQSYPILIDIHRHASTEINEPNTDFIFMIGKDNSYWEKNEKFAKKIINEINHLNHNFSSKLEIRNEKTYNQDLSEKSVWISIGNETKTPAEIEKMINILTKAFKNTLKKSF